MDTRILVPVRYAAWLSGELGQRIHTTLHAALGAVPGLRLTRLPRGFLVEADEDAGPMLEAVHAAVRDVEQSVAQSFPVFHHEMGPLWTGTLQVVFPHTRAEEACRARAQTS